MDRVILQPAGSAAAQKNFTNTVEAPVPLSIIKPHVSPVEFKDLSALYPSGKVPTWGITPGTGEANRGKWERVEIGSIVLFSGTELGERLGRADVFASGVVAYKLRSKSLATHLWGTDQNGQTWEYIYFLDEIKALSIPYRAFNKTADYAPNTPDFPIRQFTILDGERSARVISSFDLESDVHVPPVTEEEFKKAVKEFDPTRPLDVNAKTKARTEQQFLRNYHLGGKKFARCLLCVEEYPVPFLVTAHIKKRSYCSTEERLDKGNVVMPMCKFGCDELFERGYVAVVDKGQIVPATTRDITPAVDEYLNKIAGGTCPHWGTGSSPYFEWHRKFHT
jgi:hypothetical protein